MIKTTKFTDENGNKCRKDEFFNDNCVKVGEAIYGDFDAEDIVIEDSIEGIEAPDNQEILAKILLNQAVIMSELRNIKGE